MREKLKILGIRLTELSTYLGFSRPTIYRYMENYDSKKYKAIDFRVRKVFDYIMKKRTVSKIEVINFIIGLDKNENTQEFENLIKLINSDKVLIETIHRITADEGIDIAFNRIKKAFSEKGE